MDTLNNKANVKAQYATSANLNQRISFHEKYSTNKTGFANWIFSNYKIPSGAKVLELGCGTGNMWQNRAEIIAKCSELVLSDFSEGMIKTAQDNLKQFSEVSYKVIDIQDIPFEDDHFDVVIANMMLYHVPDLQQALSEVKRVLKADGTFYAATYGEHGIIEFLSKSLHAYGVTDKVNKNFTLQNGPDILRKHFENVNLLEYKDSLEVTNLDDLVEYVYSLTSMTELSQYPKNEIKSSLSKLQKNGVLSVPKEYGMFVCRYI
ncbi:MAG: methyltransferase domain-containing protein [Treponemataceae bacterium]|nr:methyltransferase domain-containing protein [Treponemataceae bacterium]